jgi:hypothetical protein
MLLALHVSERSPFRSPIPGGASVRLPPVLSVRACTVRISRHAPGYSPLRPSLGPVQLREGLCAARALLLEASGARIGRVCAARLGIARQVRAARRSAGPGGHAPRPFVVESSRARPRGDRHSVRGMKPAVEASCRPPVE